MLDLHPSTLSSHQPVAGRCTDGAGSTAVANVNMPSWIFVSSSCADAALQPRCGDCWCSFVADGLDTCPTPPEGIADSFPPSFASFYQSFQLPNPNADLLTLRTADGTTDCYPFATTLGVLNRYPASSLPQCVLPECVDMCLIMIMDCVVVVRIKT